MGIADEIKSYQKEKMVIGSKRTIKYLKLGKISKVFVAKNVPKDLLDDISYYAKLSNATVEQADLSNTELGILLKKPFKISVIGILK